MSEVQIELTVSGSSANAAPSGIFCIVNSTRSHLINGWTSRKGQHLENETLETQPNHHFPVIFVAAVLWFPCHKTIYEMSSSKPLFVAQHLWSPTRIVPRPPHHPESA